MKFSSQRLVGTALAVMVSALLFLSWQPVVRTLHTLNGLIYDIKISQLPPWPESVANIHIIDIDERTLVEIGRMPWSRSLFAQLNQKLRELGAVTIGYDILFSETEPNPATAVIERIKQQSSLATEQSDSMEDVEAQFDYDGQFVQSLSESESVLAILFHNEALETGFMKDDSFEQVVPTGNFLPEYVGFAAPIKRFHEVAIGQGFINSITEQDGFIRSAALVIKHQDKLYPSLALEVFRVYSLIDQIIPQWSINGDAAFLDGLLLGNALIPTDKDGKILVPFRGPPKTYPYTSAADVMKDRITDNRFEDAVVFVGTSATGLVDLRATPTSINYPGIEIHATVFEALMTPDTQIYVPDWAVAAVAIQLLLIAVLCIWFFPKLGPTASVGFTFALLCVAVGLNLYLWFVHYIHLPSVLVILLIVVLSVYFIGSGFFSESAQRKVVKATFDQYVPAEHINKLLSDPKAASLDGEKKELSVLFSDIRSFTSISETMTAFELKQWLNEYFSPITQTILEHDGTIDKYVGDMVMAFWGAPLDDPEHATKSIQGAFAMLERLHDVNRIFVEQGKPEAKVGIGINTGEMNVGDMGSNFRRSYTVIGDAVNLGSRLEGLTKFYGVELLVSEITKVSAPSFDYQLIDKVKVKGKDEPVTIYMPIHPKTSNQELQLFNRFNQAIACYYARDFEGALFMLSSLGDVFQNQKILKLYQERIHYFMQTPPEPDWDGSFTHTSK